MYYYDPPTQEIPVIKRRNRWPWYTAAALVAFVGIWLAVHSAMQESPLALVKEDCAAGSPYVTVSQDGATLWLETEGDEAAGASFDELVCVVVGLEVPERVTFQMDQTRALDGMQTAAWGDYSAQWTYHPSNGFALVVTTEQ